jgi:hypothetical protein
MPWSNYTRDAILNHMFRDATFTKLGTVYVALASADLTAANVTANELTIGTGGYARIAVGTTNSDWNAPATSGERRMISNTGTLSGGTASANLNGGNPIGFFGIYDASTAGNLIAFGALGTPKTILSGDAISIAPGALQLLQG